MMIRPYVGPVIVVGQPRRDRMGRRSAHSTRPAEKPEPKQENPLVLRPLFVDNIQRVCRDLGQRQRRENSEIGILSPEFAQNSDKLIDP